MERILHSRSFESVVTVFFLFGLFTGSPSVAQEAGPPDDAVDVRFQQDIAFSSDGEWLAFSELEIERGGEYSSDRWSVYVVRIDGTGLRRIATHARGATWAPDGLRLAYGTGIDGDWEITVQDLDTNMSTFITANDRADGEPAWSPDGDRIAISSETNGSRNILLVDPQTGQERSLTSTEHHDYGPSWSSDASRLVFYREQGDGKDQIWTIAPDGTGSTNVTRDRLHHTFPSFAPDGRLTFSTFDRDKGLKTITISNPDGSQRTRLDLPPAVAAPFFARWSPDGRLLAVISGNWPRSAIHLVDIATGDAFLLTR